MKQHKTLTVNDVQEFTERRSYHGPRFRRWRASLCPSSP